MTIKGVKELVAEANQIVETLSANQAVKESQNEGVMLVDIRDIRELDREGRIEGAVHAPRGMLEFWFDPESPYFRDVFGDADKKYVLYCAGGLRSALAAKSLHDMGFDNVAHVDGGFAALKDAGALLKQAD